MKGIDKMYMGGRGQYDTEFYTTYFALVLST